ncbi:MAG: hypothetical protein AAF493_23290 [Pseudomonadota bacterium]
MSKKGGKKGIAKPRNLLHDHPMLRKGGRHEKFKKKAKRNQDRIGLRKEWLPLCI